MVTLRLNPAIDRKPARLAKAQKTTKTAIVRAAVIGHLEEENDIRIAVERLKRHDAGKSRTYTLEEVERELGLAR